MFLPHPRVKVSIAGNLRDREVACSASDRQGPNFESCVWRKVSSHSSHHPQEVLLAQFSLYVHKGGLKPDSFHFVSEWSPEITEISGTRHKRVKNFFVSHSTVDDSHTTLPAAEFITEGRLRSIRLSKKEVQDILVTLKPAKATGPAGISPHVLKLTAKTISKPLTNLFQFIPPTRNLSRYMETGKCNPNI